MSTSSQSFAGDLLARWSEAVLNWSARAGQQQRELIDWSISLAQGLGHQEKSLGRALRLKSELGRAAQASISECLELMALQHACCGEQIRQGLELFRSRTVSEAQSSLASVSESTQCLWRNSTQALGRTGARFIGPWADFWLLPAVEAGA